MFGRLFGEQPTAEQKLTLLQLQKELGLRDDDALWTILVVLGHYERLYERIPCKIQQASSFAIEQANRGLQNNAESFRRRLEREMADAVVAQFKEVTADRTKADRRWATAAASTMSFILIILVGMGSYWWGRSTGEQSASAAQLWAQLPNGRYAQQLDEVGVIADLRLCRVSEGDFRIPAAGEVICETKEGGVHKRGVTSKMLAPS
jgi:hypothetical protein